MNYIVNGNCLACSVLVLNKHYMALRVINVRKALSMLYREHAEVIDYEDGVFSNHNFNSWQELSDYKRNFQLQDNDWISAVNFYIAVPRIIRLLFYDRLPNQQVKLNRRNIFARDKNKCQYCGKKFPTSELSLDHILPKSAGGLSTWENLVCSCTKCNSKKGGRTPHQSNMHLITKPEKPKRNPFIHIHLSENRYESWKQFLDTAYWNVELQD